MILRAVEMGEGPPAVFLHGLFGQARNFAGVQRALATTHRTIALDARNHGGSPHAADMSYRTMAADVIETLDTMGVPPCPVIGHSMGGKTAMALALLAPPRLTKLVVVDIAPAAYAPHFAAILAVMVAIRLDPALTRAMADAALAEVEPDASVRSFLLANLHLGAAPSWRIGLQEITSAMPDISGWTFGDERYEGPVLFVLGGRSRYVRPEHRPAIAAHFPRARMVTLKDAGHWVHADAPKPFVDTLAAALA